MKFIAVVKSVRCYLTHLSVRWRTSGDEPWAQQPWRCGNYWIDTNVPVPQGLQPGMLSFALRIGAGRFLYVEEKPKPNERFLLDLNRAYNPPCAFSEFTTCPLPPPQNRLAVAVEAGDNVTLHVQGLGQVGLRFE